MLSAFFALVLAAQAPGAPGPEPVTVMTLLPDGSIHVLIAQPGGDPLASADMIYGPSHPRYAELRRILDRIEKEKSAPPPSPRPEPNRHP